MQHITIHSRSPEEGGGDTLLSATFTTDRHPTGKLRKLAEVAFSRLRIGGTLRIENITVNAGVEGKGVEVMANLPQTAILLIQDELAGRGFYPKNVTLAVNQDQKTMARNILVPIITSSWKRVDEETPGSVATRLPKY